MSRPKKYDENLIAINFKVPASLNAEIEALVSGAFAGAKTPLLLEFVKLGIEEFKKQNPDIVERARKRLNISSVKKTAHAKG